MPKILNEREQAFITELKKLTEKFGVDFETSWDSTDIDIYGDSIGLSDINEYLK